MSSAQVGIYGIGEANTDAVVQAALGALAASGLPYEIGGMSTVIDAGDDGQLFATLQAMYAAAASHGAVLMSVSVSNACPVSLREDPGG
jgi:uncharacterized protein YqgV (UPF0045/DUF77 family)